MSKKRKKKNVNLFDNPSSYPNFSLPNIHTYYRPNRSTLSNINIKGIKTTVKRPRTSIVKFRGSNLSELRQEYNKQVTRIHNIERKLVNQGYIVKTSVPDVLPKRVTRNYIEKLKSIKPADIRANVSTPVELYGGNVILVKNSDIKKPKPKRKPLKKKTTQPKPKTPEITENVKRIIYKQKLGNYNPTEMFTDYDALSESEKKMLKENINNFTMNDVIQDVYIDNNFQLGDDSDITLESFGEEVIFPDAVVEGMKNPDNPSSAKLNLDKVSPEVEKLVNEMNVYHASGHGIEDFYYNKVMQMLDRLPEDKVVYSGGKKHNIPDIRMTAKYALQNTYNDIENYYPDDDVDMALFKFDQYLGDHISEIAREIEVIIFESKDQGAVYNSKDKLLKILVMNDTDVLTSIAEQFEY